MCAGVLRKGQGPGPGRGGGAGPVGGGWVTSASGGLVTPALDARPTWWPGLAWTALLLAFSPVLVDLATEPVQTVGERVILLAAAAAAIGAALAPRPRAASPGDGGLAIAGGLALELVGIAAGAWSLARLGFPVASLGLARALGWPSPWGLLPLFAAVPIPTSLLELLAPPLQSAVTGLSARIWECGAPGITAHASGLVTPRGLLEISATDIGIRSAVALGAVGWARGLRSGDGGRRAIQWASGALAWHTAAVLAAAGLASGGDLPTARGIIRWCGPAGVALAGLAGLGLALRAVAHARERTEDAAGGA